MVEEVKEFCPELQAVALCDTEALQHGEVEVNLIRTTQVAVPGIAKLAGEGLSRRQSRKHKGALVKEAIQSLLAR